jgi:hypothetical protein
MAVATHPTDALADLRRARRRHRSADVDVFEALYRAYLTAIVLGIGVLLLSGVTGDRRLGSEGVDRVRRDGGAAVGLAAALAVAIGLRSGGRGGPLVVEAADVRYVLLAPVDRTHALRGPAVRQLRFGAFGGATAGAIAGMLAYRRLPGTPGAWVAWGAAVGALAAVAAIGCAIVVSGTRVHRGVANLLALGVLGWSVADLLAHTVTSPLSWLGRMAIWPLHFDPLALAGAVVMAIPAAIGWVVVGGTSLEAAERRASLAGQLRFAATLQDVRTVIVLRRQLAQERPRTRPWIRIRAKGEGGWPIWRRGWHGILRWPAVRVVRLAIVGAAAGLSMVAVWRGTTPMIVVAGLLLFVTGLDAVEPLAQDVDHPDLADSFPIPTGDLQIRQVAPSVLVMVAVVIVAGATALAVTRDPAHVLPVAGILALPAAAVAAGAAAMSVVKGPPPLPGSDKVFLPPEATGMRLVFRLIWPPALVVASLLPALVAHNALVHHRPWVTATAAAEMPVVLLASLTLAWLRFQEQVHASMADATGGAFGG